VPTRSTVRRSSGSSAPGCASSWPAPASSTANGCAAKNRRVDAREQLRSAHELFSSMGADGFAERAARELLATGGRARKRRADTRGELTPQEAQIAHLAREGYSNPEMGAQLFISPRTVEYHLHKVFTKLAITSRIQLDGALPSEPREPQPV
jgi:DNA-binding NarL/FixJ family response regulator